MHVLMEIFAVINMLGGIRIKTPNSKNPNSWLGYKISRAQIYAMEALCKKDRLFHNRLKVLGNTSFLVEATFNSLQA